MVPSVVSPGNYDGVHRGHQAILGKAKQLAAERGHQSLAMFFDPHPVQVLASTRSVALLTTPARRAELLRTAGADAVRVQPFDATFAALSPAAFLDDVLLREAGASAIVVGADFRFGHNRTGDLGLLKQLGAQRSCDVHVVGPVMDTGVRISSTVVREHIVQGDVRRAEELLGRPHDVDGTVVRGDQRGRAMGFPTANLDCEPVVLPGDGVYAVTVCRVNDSETKAAHVGGGVANIGIRPTFGAGRSVEVHLLNFAGDLYGARLRIGFLDRLRGERKFADLKTLQEQITRDVAKARDVLAKRSAAGLV